MTAKLSEPAQSQVTPARQCTTGDERAGRTGRVAELVAEAPFSARGILTRALDGTGGRKNAITAMCLVCTGYERETVRNCTGWSCPLWKWRPFQSRAETAPKTAAVEGVPEKDRAASVVADARRGESDAP